MAKVWKPVASPEWRLWLTPPLNELLSRTKIAHTLPPPAPRPYTRPFPDPPPTRRHSFTALAVVRRMEETWRWWSWDSTDAGGEFLVTAASVTRLQLTAGRQTSELSRPVGLSLWWCEDVTTALRSARLLSSPVPGTGASPTSFSLLWTLVGFPTSPDGCRRGRLRPVSPSFPTFVWICSVCQTPAFPAGTTIPTVVGGLHAAGAALRAPVEQMWSVRSVAGSPPFAVLFNFLLSETQSGPNGGKIEFCKCVQIYEIILPLTPTGLR